MSSHFGTILEHNRQTACNKTVPGMHCTLQSKVRQKHTIKYKHSQQTAEE